MVRWNFFMNSFFAVSLDQLNWKEKVIYSVGYADEFFSGNRKHFTSEQRELGELIFDFSCSIEDYMFSSRYNVLCGYIDEYQRFISKTAIRWECDPDLIAVHGMFDRQFNFMKLPLVNDKFLDIQKHMKLDDNRRFSSTDILDALNREYDNNGKIRIMYIDNCPYIVTDFDFVGLFRYYLDELYNMGLFPRKCMRCNSWFLAKKKHGNVLCSSECQKKSNAHNSMEYYKKMDENDKIYYNLYHKWKQRINKLKENNEISSDKIDKLIEGLTLLTEINKARVSYRKKLNVSDKDGIPNHHSFDEEYKSAFQTQDDNMYSILKEINSAKK